jgi:HEAT repeat-containing protein 5
MYPASEAQITAPEVESLITLCVKSLEGADQLTRRSLSRLVGHLLALTQQRTTVVPVEAPKKPRKRDTKAGDAAEEEDDPPVAKVNPEDLKSMLTPVEMLQQLSAQYNKATSTRKIRIGIFDFYAAALSQLGVQFVEQHYITIIQHFLADLVTNTRSLSSRYEILLTRRLVGILLRELIGDRMLSEQAQIIAIQDLSSTYLRKWPALMPGQVAPLSQVLTIVLKEVGGLLEQLGNAPPPVQVCARLSRTIN